uniref:Uncharacterized protein n=1 Tax=Acrobeloides nanus TaxID=290746 RepID=A0A914CET8_9BILA
MGISKNKKQLNAQTREMGKNNAKGMALRNRRVTKSKKEAKKKKPKKVSQVPNFHPNPIVAMNAHGPTRGELRVAPPNAAVVEEGIERLHRIICDDIENAWRRNEEERAKIILQRKSVQV